MTQGAFYKTLRAIYRFFRRGWQAKVKAPETPTVYICSHQNMHGPITTLAYLPFPVHAWILNVFFDRESCRKQYAEFTFSKRFGMPQRLADALAWIVSGVVSGLVRSTGAIPVWRGTSRINETFRDSVEALKAGDSLLIFPDVQYSQDSGEMGSIYEGFILLGRMYAHSTGLSLNFVPLYCDEDGKEIREGEPIAYDPEAPSKSERARISAALVESVNRMAAQKA